MRVIAGLTPVTALVGCVAPHLEIATNPDASFEVRYCAGLTSVELVDAAASEHCDGVAEFLSEEAEADTPFTYRTYRCARS